MSHAPSSPGAEPESSRDAEQFLFQFDRAWRSGTPPRIEDCLSRWQNAATGNAFESRRFLEDLIKIDLEYRWRSKPAQPGPLGPAPRLEDYVKNYPQLATLHELSPALIGQEYWVRQRWGDRPRHSDYVGRFPRHGPALLAELAKIDGEITTDLESKPIPPAKGPASQPDTRITDQRVESVAALVAALTGSELLTAAQQKELTNRLASRFAEPRALAAELLRRGWLSAYQINQLLQGRRHELALGPYVLLERLGEGGAGQVFKARHRRLDRLVALKVIRKELLTDPEVIGRFHREIQVLSQLDHPNIVRAFDAGVAGTSHFLAMEYVEGPDLGKLVKQGGPMPVLQACAYIRQAALGLEHAHERGLVHRDIKPHNLVMSVRDGLIKVADLGLARLPRALGQETTAVLDGAKSTGTLTPQHAVMMGTADYLSPEQALDFHAADIRADIYSLGCTFYYLLAGQPPFAGGNLAFKVAKHLQAEPPAIEQFRQDLPDGLAAILRKMLAKRAEDRYQTPADVATALAPLAQGGPASAADPRKYRRRAALSLAALIMVGLSFLVLRPSPSARVGSDGKPFWPGQVKEFALHKQLYVHTVAFSGNGKVAASSGPNNSIALWDTATGVEQFRLPGHKGTVSHLSLSPNGRFLASGSVEEKAWKLWDLNDQRELATFSVDKQFHASVTLVGPFSADGKYVAACQGDGKVGLVEIATRKTAVTFEHTDTPSALALSPDGRTIAMALSNLGRVRLDDIASRKELGMETDGNYVFSIGFSPDSTLLAVARWSHEVHLLDAPGKLKPRSICKGHKEGVQALAFAADGKTLATGSKDNLIKLWDPATGRERDTFKGHTRAVRALSFTPDGKLLLSGGDDDTVRVWRVRE